MGEAWLDSTDSVGLMERSTVSWVQEAPVGMAAGSGRPPAPVGAHFVVVAKDTCKLELLFETLLHPLVRSFVDVREK